MKKDLFEQLAEDFRPMLHEIMRKYVETDGYVGLLFDFGEGKDYVAFAEAICPERINKAVKDTAERYPYRYEASESFLLKYFRDGDFTKRDYIKHRLSVNDFAPRKSADQFHLLALMDLFPTLLKPGDTINFWTLSLRVGKPRYVPCVYLYFFDVVEEMSKTELKAISKISFFLTHGIRSVLSDYSFVFHDQPEDIAAIKELLFCMEDVATLPSMERREEKRVALIGKVAEEIGELQSQKIFAHDMDAPIGIFNIYREQLPDDVKMAADYIEIWYRMAKRQMNYPMPDQLSRVFLSPDAFLKCVLQLAHYRAENRGVLPRCGGAFISVGELLEHEGDWLSLDYDPSDMKYLEERFDDAVANCAKTFLLYLSIGALYHSIDYAFSGGTRRFDQWQDAIKDIRKAALSISLDKKGEDAELVIRNISIPDATKSTLFNNVLSSMSIGQKLGPYIFEQVSVEVQQGEPRPYKGDVKEWESRIIICRNGSNG